MKTFKSILVVLLLIASTSCKNKGNQLKDGRPNLGPNGAFSASDFNNDGTVTRAEIDEFIAQNPERKVGLVSYFEQFDTDGDALLSEEELSKVEPDFAFNGTDADGDGIVTKKEVENYATVRPNLKMGLGDFFDLVDMDNNGEVSPVEIETARQNFLFPRG